MKKLLIVAALITTPILLNACQSDMSHDGMMMKDNNMMHEEKVMDHKGMMTDDMKKGDMNKDAMMMEDDSMKKDMM